MPMVKGAKFNPKTGKFTMPEGYKNQKKIKTETVKAKGPTRRKISENVRVAAKQAKDASTFQVFALYPTGRAFLEYMDQPSYEAIAARYGGGQFQVCEMDRNTGEYIGEPTVYPIDRMAHPPKLAGFQSLAPGLGAPGFQHGQQHFGQPGFGQPPFGGFPIPGAKNEEVEELEDEIEELKETLARVQAELATARREREEALRQAQEERAAMERKALEDRFTASLEKLSSQLAGDKKNPLDVFIEFKRLESELKGPLQGSNPVTEQVQGVLQMFQLVEKLKEMAKPAEPQVGAAGAFTEVLRLAAPLIQQSREAQAAQAAFVPTAPAPAPVPEKPDPEAQRMNALVGETVKVMGSKAAEMFQLQNSPGAFVNWFRSQGGEGFNAMAELIKVEKPEAFIEAAAALSPESVDTPEKKAWVLESVKAIQESLLS